MNRSRRAALAAPVLFAILATGLGACSDPAEYADQPGGVAGSVVGPLLEPCPPASEIPCVADGAVLVVDLAGTGSSLVYASNRAAGPDSWGGWQLDAQRSLDPEAGVLIDAQGRRHAVEAIPRLAEGSETLLVADESGATVDEFDLSGRLVATRDGLTGGARNELTYDGDGRLVQADPATGATVELGYDDAGLLSSIRADGIRTDVRTDADGRIVELIGPDRARWTFAYDAGRLVRAAAPTGATTSFTYSDDGSLTSVTEPAGGSVAYERTVDGESLSLEIRSSSGAVVSLEERAGGGATTRRFTSPDGGVTTEEVSQGRRHVERADGSVLDVVVAPDPRFGATAPIRAEQRLTLPSGAEVVSTSSRTATLATAGDPLAVERVEGVETGPEAFAWNYDGGARTVTSTSPEGRVASWTLDDVGRAIETRSPVGEVTEATYDDAGRIVAVADGEATWTRAFDPATGTVTLAGPDRTSTLVVDEHGRVLREAHGTEAPTEQTYDERGDLVEVRPSGDGAHVLVRDGAGRVSASAVPAIAGEPIADVVFERDDDGNVVRILRGGADEIVLTRSPSGAIESIESADVSTTNERDLAGLLRRLEVAGGASVTREHDGSRLRTETWEGAVGGSVSYEYNDRGFVSEIQVVDATVAVERDDDGALVAIGPVRRVLDPDSGSVTTSRVGEVVTATSYDRHGRVSARETSGPSGVVATTEYRRDAAGRVVVVTETVEGATSTTEFAYDAAGRLVPATDDAATIDPAGRLTSLGSASITYDGAGRVVTVTEPAGTTTYEWDALGRLAGVRLPDGRHVTYVIDGAGRRIARDLDGERTDGWLYRGDLEPIAELDADGAVRNVLLHDDDSHLVGLVRGGEEYAVVTDQRGSPVLIVDGAGSVVDRAAYDAQGRLVTETAPGTTTIGFAGGITDPLTGLVHFGAREYSPRLQRWLSPDPLGFASSDPNLYRYANGDPVNLRDLTGLDAINSNPTVPAGTGRSEAGDLLDQVDPSGSGSGGGPTAELPAFPFDPPGGGSGARPSGGSGGGSGTRPPGGSGNGGPRPPANDPRNGGGSSGDFNRPADGGGQAPSGADGPSAGANGDTHIFTLTHQLYDLQLTGEYVAARDPEGGFEVQIRQVPVAGSTTVATVGAVALDVDGTRVGIYAREVDPLLIDGVPTPLDVGVVDLGGGGTVRRVVDRWQVEWADGSRVDVLGELRLNIQIRPSPGRVPRIDGLIGTADGTLRTADGEALPATPWPPSFEAIHQGFGPTWRLTADESLFDHLPGESTDGFHDPAFPSGPPDLTTIDPATLAAAQRLCAALADRGEPAVVAACVLDVAATGDPSFVTDAQVSGATSPIGTTAGTTAGDDPPESLGPERAIDDGETVTGAIEAPGDVARFVVEVPDGIGFALLDAELSCDLGVTIERDDGQALFGSSLCLGTVDHLRPSPTSRLQPGRYHLAIRGDDGATGPFSFRFVAAKPSTFDVVLGDQITSDGVGLGTIDVPGGIHLLRFDADGATGVTIEGTAADASACGDLRIVVYDLTTGTSVLRDATPCDGISQGTLPDPTGSYVAVVDSPTWTTGSYEVTIQASAAG